MSAPIPVLATIAEACRLVLQRRNDLLRVGLLFLLGTFALDVLVWNYVLPMLAAATTDATGQLIIDNRFWGSVLLILITNFLLVSIFGVGWHRLVLLGSERPGAGSACSSGYGSCAISSGCGSASPA